MGHVNSCIRKQNSQSEEVHSKEEMLDLASVFLLEPTKQPLLVDVWFVCENLAVISVWSLG